MIGKQFGRLTVMELARKNKDRHYEYLCRCECGNLTIAKGSYLRRGNTRSCGCLQRELSRTRKLTHGLSKTLTYKRWTYMIDRCTNSNGASWQNYGGRGINVAPIWKNSFEEFLKEMGECPKGMTLERIDNEKGYEPGNCKWATYSEQAKNKRRRSIWKGVPVIWEDGRSCEFCGKPLIKKLREASKKFKIRKFCDRQCYSKFQSKEDDG